MATIAFLTSADLSYDSGSVVFGKMLGSALARRGHDVHLLSNRAPSGMTLDPRVVVHIQQDLLEHPIVTDRLVPDEELVANFCACTEYLESLQRVSRVELVYAQYLSFNSGAAAKFCSTNAIPLVVSSFGREFDVGFRVDVRLEKFAREAAHAISLLLVPSRSVADKARVFLNSGGAPAMLRIIAPPIDEGFLAATSGVRDRIPSSELSVASINSCFKSDKGIETILHAAALIRKRGVKSVRIILAGADDHPTLANEKRLRRVVWRLGLADAVEFVGYLSRKGVKTLLGKTDIFVDARTTSGYSSVLAEAMCCGAAVCCTATDAARAVVRNGRNGLLFRRGDAHALANAILSLATNEDLRYRLRSNARGWFSKHSQELREEHTFNELANEFEALIRRP